MRPITDPPDSNAFAQFCAGFGTRFLVTIDTEEEFDWDAPFQREGHTLDHVNRLRRFQTFCEGEKVSPVWLVDYPVATSKLAAEILRSPLASGNAEIGVHLHPWVNPPHREEVTDRNSFAGNLPATLVDAKFQQIRDAISRNFGVDPKIYRAGRYGIGPDTARILRKHGIAIDSSVRARFDYSAHGGRNFCAFPVVPYWVDDERTLLELPLTTVYDGKLGGWGDTIYPALWRIPRMRGVLARLGLVDRIAFTPEGITISEAIRGIDRALAEGLPLLVFSFHSPSLAPGHTPYVRSENDLDAFYDWWRAIFSYCSARGVKPTSVDEIMGSVAV